MPVAAALREIALSLRGKFIVEFFEVPAYILHYLGLTLTQLHMSLKPYGTPSWSNDNHPSFHMP